MDQMKAIWAALDEMLEKDPEKYKEFIEEQLEAGRSHSASKLSSPGAQAELESLSSFKGIRGTQNLQQLQPNNSDVSGHSKGVEKSNSTKVQSSLNPTLLDINETKDGGEVEFIKLKLPIVGSEPMKIKETKKCVLIEEIYSEDNEESED